ncbi:MAG: twin-arginine translocase TatA/TatE family subunit [Propioniciclava sp.]|uniref:Sec-independent protein translocase subunit TatA/TatB n=1 Tax=Propioniciclava sp. TaxID=2038686 RepID=UPI0039E2FB17
MPFNMQGWEWVILIILGLLIFGGSRLAGAGKNAGRALREFKDETRQIKADEERAQREAELARRESEIAGLENRQAVEEVVEAEVIEPQPEKRDPA